MPLNELHKQVCSKDASLRISAIKNLQAYDYDKVSSMLLKALHDRNYAVRSVAVEALGIIGNDEIIDEILPLLQDPHYEVRYVVAETLGFFKSKKAIIPLIDSLKDTDEVVRLNAAESLGKLKAKEAIPALIEKLSDRNELVRGYAAEAIGEIGDKKTIKVLTNALEGEKRNASKVRILEALFKLGLESSLYSIIKMLNTRSYRVRCATVNILTELANDNNRDEIYSALEKRLQREQTVAVQSSIVRCMTQLKQP